MAFPTTPLGIRVRLAFGANIAASPATWTWTDVTAYWHASAPVENSWGATEGAIQAETAHLSLTLKNTDGRFTAYDPRSPYWPNVVKWTPIQYDIDLGDGAGWRNRFSGFVRRWPLTWPGRSSKQALARIEAVGVLGRLGRGRPPTRSPMRRSITSPQYAASGLLAYWPCEDEADSAYAASALAGQPPMVVAGTVAFASLDPSTSLGGTLRRGTMALPELKNGGSLTGPVPAGASSPTQWAVQCYGGLYTSGFDLTCVLASWEATGFYTRWRIQLTEPAGTTDVIVTNPSGVDTTVASYAGQAIDTVEYRVDAIQSGADIAVRLMIKTKFGFLLQASGTIVTTTLGRITRFTANPNQQVVTAGLTVGHVQIWDDRNAPSFSLDVPSPTGQEAGLATTAYIREAAHARLARLCAEDGVALTVPGVTADMAIIMGSQPDGTPLDLYGQCETTDQGVIYESGFGLGYLPREARCNAPVALTIDAALGQLGMPFTPVDDDQALRNIWRVDRPGGSSAIAEDQASIDQAGPIDDTATIIVATDDVLADHASWRLHLSTVAEPRYPSVSIDLGAHPELAATWCAVKPGSRIQVINPPEQNVPGVVDQLVVGGGETFRGRRSWKASMNVVPASAWQVAALDGEARLDSDTSTLTAGITSSALTWQVTTTDPGDLWTTDPAEFPLDIVIDGEQITLSGITGATSPQTCTASARAVNGVTKAHLAGAPVHVADPIILAL